MALIDKTDLGKRLNKIRTDSGLSMRAMAISIGADPSYYNKAEKYDGVNDADIMALTGHKDPTAYAKYLRDLGMLVDIKNINSKSRAL